MEYDEKNSMQELTEEDLQDVSGGISIPTEAKVGLGTGLTSGIIVGGGVGFINRGAGTRNAALPAVGAGVVSGAAVGGTGAAIVAGIKKIASSRV